MNKDLENRVRRCAKSTLLAVFMSSACLLSACAARASDEPRAFDLQAHRGGRALAPENTLTAFSNAIDIGVTTLELDIGLTADNVVVISHDTVLNPDHTRDAGGAFLKSKGPAIRALTLAQLQGYDVGRLDPASNYGKSLARQVPHDGERIPTLASLFELVKKRGAEHVRFNIETKVDPTRPDETATPEQMVSALLAEIDRAGMAKRVTLQSFDWRTLALAGQAAPTLPRAYLTTARTLKDPRWTSGLRAEDFASVPKLVEAAAAGGKGPVIWSPAYNDLGQAQISQAHALGLTVLPWTVNQPADMARLIDWGADGLITDQPDVLRAQLSARGVAVPAPSN